MVQSGGDPLLREIWRIKDELSAARGHSIAATAATASLTGAKPPFAEPLINADSL